MSQTLKQGEGARSLAPGEDRRRSQRVMIRIAVTLHFTAQGKPIALDAFTANVSDHGALLVSPQNFAAGTRFVLEHKITRERQNCRVTRAPQKIGENFHVPVEFEAAATDFWKIAFPPADWKAPLS